MSEFNNINKIYLRGKLLSELAYLYTKDGIKFYKSYIEVKRLSNNVDVIPFIISENLLDEKLIENNIITVEGELNSINKKENDHIVVEIILYIHKILDNDDRYMANQALIIGTLCKKGVFRKTPNNKAIIDFIIAINENNRKTYYLPCIIWGKKAHQLEKIEIGEVLKLEGRLQSRNYNKAIKDNFIVKKTVYELSIKNFELMKKL